MTVVVPEEYRYLYVQNAERPVVKYPAPVLTQKAADVAKVSKKTSDTIDDMIRIMKKANGIGLAAPQIGLLQRIVVIAPTGKPIALINPVITRAEGQQVRLEGCLSIPGLYGEVERAAFVEVEAYDRKGKPVAFEMEGLAAQVIQHEVDHLDGVLFIDKVDLATVHWAHPETEPTKAE